MSSIGELLVIPFLSKFPIPSHGEDASSVAVQNYFGVLIPYGGLQDFLTEKKDLTITLIRNRILPLYSLDPCSPYLISTANWVIGQLAICLPEDMSSSIYQSLMKALTMEYVQDITCYPVCASASGAIAELIENSYVPPDWLILLQVVLKRISTGDENESALLFKLLGTIVEEMHVSPVMPGRSPFIISQYSWCIGFLDRGSPGNPSTPVGGCRYDSSLGLLTKFLNLLKGAPGGIVDLNNVAETLEEGSAFLPLSCVNDASVLLEFVMSSVTCMEETESLKVFELVATWADAIANWDSWEEMEDQGVFNTIKEAVNFHQRFDLAGLFLKTHFLKVCRNGTIKIGLETNKIMDFIKFDIGNMVMMTGGRNTRRVGVIKNREKHKGSFETIHVLLRAFCYV
ncbi:ARM repeat superfamily protein [Zea mays]|uniref:ARM repeat superfamily protein n=1 Tax=Zea mays TaxID=4577 RepID=A0A1D6EA73_MAIZE|nr:ARM repeat superfamily protein [Zea mays]